MNNEFENANHSNARAIATIGDGIAVHPDSREKSGKAQPPATAEIVDPAKHRREKIEKLKARLQREIARNSTASRKERNGQLFIWGAMVEGVYRNGNAQERQQLRQWATQRLTDPRHLKRAEIGFARIEGEAANV